MQNRVKSAALALAAALLLSGCRPFRAPPTDRQPRPEFSAAPMPEKPQSKGADTYETY